MTTNDDGLGRLIASWEATNAASEKLIDQAYQDMLGADELDRKTRLFGLDWW